MDQTTTTTTTPVCPMCLGPLNPSYNCSINDKSYCSPQCLAAGGTEFQTVMTESVDTRGPWIRSVSESCVLF